jgi:dienelactone hydrolase
LTLFGAVPLFLLLLIVSLLVFVPWLVTRFRLPRAVFSGMVLFLIVAMIAVAPAALRGTLGLVRILRAVVSLPQPMSGPYADAHAIVTLAPDAGRGGPDQKPVSLHLWYPTASPTVSPAPATAGPIDCGALDGALRLPKAQAPYPFILFAPWLGGKADMASLLTRSFARHGYVVAAFDDPATTGRAPGTSAEDEAVRLRTFDMTSDEGYRATLRRGALRAQREAAMALDALDRLTACVQQNPGLRDRIDFSRVGFVGYSFGGAAAAEASFLDSRIAAVVNLDGAQFGRAGDNVVRGPYFVFFEDFDPKIVSNLNSPHHYDYLLDQRDFRRTDEQLKQPDSYGFVIRGSFHDTFADPSPPIERSRLLSWLLLDPIRAHEIVQTYLLGFLDAYIKGDRRGLIGPNDPRYPEVRTFHF